MNAGAIVLFIGLILLGFLIHLANKQAKKIGKKK